VKDDRVEFWVSMTAALAILLVAVFSIWLRYWGPCWMFKYDNIAHVPARCIEVVK
jgi:hypothetical protein